MKRRLLLMLLLVLTMLYPLIACGSSIVESSTVHITPSPAPDEADKIIIDGVSFEPYSPETYNMRVNARNNGFPSFDDRQLINVVVYFNLMGPSGNGLSANISFIESWSEFPSLMPGQSCWTTSIHSIDKSAVDAAEKIVFTAVEFRYSQNSQGEWKQIKESLLEPVSFNIADIIPVGVSPFTLENVSVDFVDSLPNYITRQTPWQAGLMEGFDYALNDSETYAIIRFAITNLTKQNVILDDVSGNFRIQLNFDDGFLYSTDGPNPSFFKVGNRYAVLNNPSQNHSQRIGDEIVLSPLVTYDVELYLRCAKAVATQTGKNLILSVYTSAPGYRQVDIDVR